ncbi:hypothetical protein J6W91_02070 [Candidatus Saccharibacteria bacterium]|nr:hypothetical protein [Candidatus Saccharibacteria bacterium]
MILIIFFSLILLFGFTAFTGAPYVPSLKSEIKKAFTKLYPLSKKDFLIDLGAGDGIVQKIASKYGAKSVGIELNPIIALIAIIRLRKLKNAKIVCKNFYSYEFPEETTVVYVFGDSRDIEKIKEKIENEATRLKKPLYIISNGFEFPGLKKIKTVGAYHLYKTK